MALTTSRTFRVAEDPGSARRILEEVRVEDGSRFGVLPPGVTAERTSSGFSASAPLGMMRFGSSFDVQADGRGGSLITERATSSSFVPGGEVFAQVMHAIATDPEAAYHRARQRR